MKSKTIDPTKPHATKDDVAEHFGVTRRTVDNWIADGVPHFKRGHTIRFSLAQLEEHFRQGKGREQ